MWDIELLEQFQLFQDKILGYFQTPVYLAWVWLFFRLYTIRDAILAYNALQVQMQE